MLHDIAPHVYSNAFHPHPARLEDKTLCFAQGGVYLREDGSFPLRRDYPAEAEVLYLFDYDGAGVYLSREAPLGCTLRPVRALRELAQPDAFLGGTAQHLSDWYGMTRFCGRCGAKMTHSATERAMVCPACGNTVYPRISPAVIVAVTHGDRLLLTKYSQTARPGTVRNYALIAGFAEIGEPLEGTVRREVMEEVGLPVKNIRFYKSQPWSFSSSLLSGFYCDLDTEDETVTLQEDELGEGTWFDRSELPEGGSSISLTHEMIERFRQGPV